MSDTAQAITGVTRFPCKQCGAKLEYAPGTTDLKCPYCGCANQIAAPKDTAQVLELDYLSALRDLKDKSDKFEHMVVKCGACAAEIEPLPNQTAFACPFCGSNIVATAQAATHIKPNGVLPFRMTGRQQATESFRSWLGKLWFAPNALKREGFLDAAFTGIYVPAWTYDSKTTTTYDGERGDAYYETRTVMVNGRATSQQVRRIRWSSVSGIVYVGFDDVLVMATRSLDQKKLEKLDPWNLPQVVPYADAYLAGFRSECYQVGLEEGFEEAKDIMHPTIVSAIESDIGGDEQRIHSQRTRYDAITFKHILLPVWISAYRFNSKVYRFMINARTGEVVGERPYSALKITAFVIMCLIVIAIIAIVAANR